MIHTAYRKCLPQHACFSHQKQRAAISGRPLTELHNTIQAGPDSLVMMMPKLRVIGGAMHIDPNADGEQDRVTWLSWRFLNKGAVTSPVLFIVCFLLNGKCSLFEHGCGVAFHASYILFWRVECYQGFSWTEWRGVFTCVGVYGWYGWGGAHHFVLVAHCCARLAHSEPCSQSGG